MPGAQNENRETPQSGGSWISPLTVPISCLAEKGEERASGRDAARAEAQTGSDA